MAELLKERVKVVYTIGSAAEKIEHQLHGVVKMVSAQTMESGCGCGCEGCGAGRCGAVVAGLFELRPV